VSKRLEIDSSEEAIDFGVYKATLLSETKGKPISEGKWLTIRIRDLKTEEEARSVGEKLAVKLRRPGGAAPYP
jgi:hypothetical protein